MLAHGHVAPTKMKLRSPSASAKPIAGVDCRSGGISKGAAARGHGTSGANKPRAKPEPIATVKRPTANKVAQTADEGWETF